MSAPLTRARAELWLAGAELRSPRKSKGARERYAQRLRDVRVLEVGEPQQIDLTEAEAELLSDLCQHPDEFGRLPGGWCFDCDARMRAVIYERLVGGR